MKTRLLILFAFIISVEFLNAQNINFGWVKQIDNADQPYLATDNNGNTFYATKISNLVVLTKYDTSGNTIWSKTFTRNNTTEGYLSVSDIDVDGNGNIYLAGHYSNGAVDLDPGANENYLPSPIGKNNTFVVKLNTNGNFVWAKSIGSITSSRDVEPYSLAVDSDSNVLLTGYFEDTVDFNPGAGEELITAEGGLNRVDMYVVKLDNLGNYQWVRTIGLNNKNCRGYVVNSDANNNVYLLGEFNGNIDFDHSSGTTLLKADIEKGYIMKYKPNGDFEWAKNLELKEIGDWEYAKTDALGNTYILNNFGGSFDFDPSDTGVSTITSRGDDDVVTYKYDSDGNFVWANQIGGTGRDRGYGIAVNEKGVYVTGFFNNTIDLDSNQTGEELTSNGGDDIFVVQFDVDGNFLNTAQMGDFGRDFGQSISIDDNGGVYSAGEFTGQTFDMDPTSGTTILNSLNGNAYVQKLQFPIPNGNNNDLYTSIPDQNFEQFLIDKGYDSENIINGKVLTDDIKNITQLHIGIVDNIIDLTGIEGFAALTHLYFQDNPLQSLNITQNTNLEILSLSHTEITSINTSNNVNLTEIYIFDTGNSLTSLDVSNNVNLTSLFVSDAQFSSLDISNNINLTALSIKETQLATIDVSNNIKLTELNLSSNQLTAIDITKLVDLEDLDLKENKITQLDLSKNIKIKDFDVDDNKLTSLNFTENTILERINCEKNELTELNLKNGNNSAIIYFSSKLNPSLICILVDDKDYSNNNNSWYKDATSLFVEECVDYTYIPDNNFELHIESLGLGNGINNDGYVETAKIAALTTLDIGNKNIADATGIEDFVALTELIARDNSIKNIDVSKNINLENLDLFTNTLSTIDVSKNTKLKELHVGANQLTNIDVSMLPDLTKLWCFNNQLSTLDVSNNSLLEVLNSSTNQLSSINLSSNINLEVLYTDNNNLALLDLSTNGKLVQLTVTNNQLNSLNVKNGNNTNINIFFTTGNSSLTCIEVDDATYSESIWNDVNATWNAIDAQHTFNIECPKYTSIHDANFEAYLESINVGNGIANDKLVNKESIQVLTILNIADKNIADITGIEDFSSLVELDARNNTITQVDLSKNTSLEKLYLANNQITSIDFSNNTSLKIIDVGENQLTDIDVHLLTDLESLSCYKNQLSNTNLYSNKNLLAFIANENQLKAVDIRENKNLFWIDVDDNLLENLTIKNGSNTKITTFSATGNPNLTCIEVDDITFSNTNWTNKDAQSNFSIDCAPANDDCSNAIPLTFGQQTPGDVNSGNANNNPTCATGNVIADVWFSVVVPDTGEFAIQGSSFGGQLKFAIYQSCASVAPIACGTSISLKNLTVGTKFYLKVWLEGASKNTNQTGSGTFTITAQESSVLSVDDFTQVDVELILYPNPASTFVNIKMSDNSEINNIEINNLIGKRVLFEKTDNDRNLQINISNLSKGVYFIRTKTEHKIISKKLIIN